MKPARIYAFKPRPTLQVATPATVNIHPATVVGLAGRWVLDWGLF